MGYCRDCRHRGTGGPLGFWTCHKLRRLEDSSNMDPAGVAADAGYAAFVVTLDFGCTLHEPGRNPMIDYFSREVSDEDDLGPMIGAGD